MFEYKREIIPGLPVNDPETFQRYLNHCGREGWELVSVLTMGANREFYFKRLLKAKVEDGPKEVPEKKPIVLKPRSEGISKTVTKKGPAKVILFPKKK